MMIFAAEVRAINLENKELKPYIDCVLYDSSVNRTNIISEFNFETIGVESLNKNIKEIGEKKGYKKNFIKSVNKLIFKERKNTDFAIDEIIRYELLKNADCVSLDKLLENEKEIVFI